MNKELEYIRKAVIMACHADCESYEEALKKELGFGCRFYIGDRINIFLNSFKLDDNITYYTALCEETKGIIEANINGIDSSEIIGQPITLARLLITLKYNDIEFSLEMDNSFTIRGEGVKFHWDLTKNKDDCKLQKTKTILSISKLLGYEEN